MDSCEATLSCQEPLFAVASRRGWLLDVCEHHADILFSLGFRTWIGYVKEDVPSETLPISVWEQAGGPRDRASVALALGD